MHWTVSSPNYLPFLYEQFASYIIQNSACEMDIQMSFPILIWNPFYNCFNQNAIIAASNGLRLAGFPR